MNIRTYDEQFEPGTNERGIFTHKTVSESDCYKQTAYHLSEKGKRMLSGRKPDATPDQIEADRNPGNLSILARLRRLIAA